MEKVTHDEIPRRLVVTVAREVVAAEATALEHELATVDTQTHGWTPRRPDLYVHRCLLDRDSIHSWENGCTVAVTPLRRPPRARPSRRFLRKSRTPDPQPAVGPSKRAGTGRRR